MKEPVFVYGGCSIPQYAANNPIYFWNLANIFGSGDLSSGAIEPPIEPDIEPDLPKIEQRLPRGGYF
jgi:hypothetical protein